MNINTTERMVTVTAKTEKEVSVNVTETDVVVIEPSWGLPGRKGDPGYTPVKGVDYFDGGPGPEGPPSTAADKTFTQDFLTSSTVTVTHNLAKYPAVIVINSAGDEVEGDIRYLNSNSLTVIFNSAFSGKIICN